MQKLCLPCWHLCEEKQGIPWLATYEEVRPGIGASAIDRALRELKVLSVLPPIFVVEHGTN